MTVLVCMKWVATTVVVDPLDGSTNASLGLPWCATALCLVIDGAPAVSAVEEMLAAMRAR